MGRSHDAAEPVGANRAGKGGRQAGSHAGGRVGMCAPWVSAGAKMRCAEKWVALQRASSGQCEAARARTPSAVANEEGSAAASWR